MIRYKITIVVLLLSICRTGYAMGPAITIMLPVRLLQLLYPTQRGQAEQACKKGEKLIREVIKLSIDSKKNGNVLEEIKTRLTNELLFMQETCEKREEVVILQAIAPDNRVEKILIQADYYVVKGFEQTEKKFELLQKISQQSKSSYEDQD